jgi:hypothetical protein
MVWVQSCKGPLLLGLLLWLADAVLSGLLDRCPAGFCEPAGLHGAAVRADGAILPLLVSDCLHVEVFFRRKRSGSGEQSSIM